MINSKPQLPLPKAKSPSRQTMFSLQDFPESVAFAVFPDKQSFFLQCFGQSFYGAFRPADFLCNHFLCCLRILFQKIQHGGLFQSAKIALWICTLNRHILFPQYMAETVFEFIGLRFCSSWTLHSLDCRACKHSLLHERHD